MKKLTRFVSVLLSALMVASMFTALNFTAFAADSKLTIRANSNIFPTQTQEFDADTNQITVTWWMQVSDANMVNTQCVITYDSSKLAVDMTDGVTSTVEDGKRVDRILRVTDGVGTVTNYAPQHTYTDLHENNPSGKFLDGESDNDASIKVNSVNLEGRELTESNGKVPFVSVTFNPKDGAQGVTNVNLYVEIMQIRGESEEEEHYFIARSEIADNKVSYMPETPSAVYAGTFDDYNVQAGDVFTVAGTAHFLGTEWEAKPTVNVMTKGSDGIYKITVKNVKAVSGAVYEVKVVEFKNGDQSSAIWHGVPGTGNNVDFGLKSDCDVTVTYNPSTGEIKVTGTGVTDPSYKIDYVAVVGNGKDVPSFVNGKNWDPTAAANKMTASSNVYEITYKNVAANKDLEFKFAANGAWALNWGNGSAVTPGTAMDAYDGGENIKFNYKSSKSTFDLTLKLDLTNWDADKKTGAKFTVTAKDCEQPTTEKPEPTTVAPTTAAPTTVAPTTVAPTTVAPTTVAPTTVAPTTEAPTTEPVHVHTIVVDKGYPATCTSTGLTDGSHCETCGEVIKAQEVIPMHPDTMVVKGYPATYEKDGLTDGVRCKRCGTWVVERQVIPKLIRYGDVNRDGEITIEDATLLQKFIAELVTFNEDQKRAADTNGDGQIRIDDVTEIQKYVAELIHELGPKQTSS